MGPPKLGCVPDEPSSAAAYPWPAQSATGVGSMPGTDPLETMRLIVGELPGLPFLAELPGRGPGADLTGRTAAMLVELAAETTPRGWRLAGLPGGTCAARSRCWPGTSMRWKKRRRDTPAC